MTDTQDMTAAGPKVGGVRAAPDNPYVGPRAFRPGEKLFGRDREADELLDLLLTERVVLLHAPSGAGKTSLLQASLMRLLSEEGLHVLPVARVKWRAGDTPAMSATRNPYLYSVMVDLARGQDGVPPAPLLDTGDDLEAFLTRGMGTPSDELQVLIFDQFEELLTVDSTDTAGKHAFCRELGRVLQSKSRFAVFAMRDEYLGALEPYLGHFSTRLAARYRLDFLTPEAAKVSIEAPASPRKRYDPTAVEKLVDDLRRVKFQSLGGKVDERPGAFVEPVHLQVVCTRIWNGVPATQSLITVNDVERYGNVDGALRGYFADAVARAATEGGSEEADIRHWIVDDLVVDRLRGQTLLGNEKAAGVSEQSLAVLENSFVIRRDERRGAIWLELAHDRLVVPIVVENEDWQRTRGDWLESSADRWRNSERRADQLLNVRELVSARRSLATMSAPQRKRVEGFLKASLYRVVRNAAAVGLTIAFVATLFFALDSRNAKRLLADNEAQRVELKKIVDSLTAIQDKYIYQRAWGLDSGSSDAKVEVSKQANVALQSLARTSRPEQRQQVIVRYQLKVRDKQRIEFALRELGFDVEGQKATIAAGQATNSIAYGPDVPLRDVKLIALTLVRGGTEVRAICPFRDSRTRVAVAEVNYSPRAAQRPPISLADLDLFTEPARGVHCADDLGIPTRAGSAIDRP